MDPIKPLSRFLGYTINLLFLVNIFCIFFMRRLLIRFLNILFVSYSVEYFNFRLYLLYFISINTLIILFNLSNIFKHIYKGTPFIIQNYKSLKSIAVCSIIISFAFIFKMIVYPTLLTLGIIFAFIIFGLAAYLFSQLFKQAVSYKDEIDFTI